MSLEVLTAIWRNPPCQGGDLLCLLAIADNADDEGFGWPSMATIARKAAMSERGARKCIRKLESAGLLAVHKGGGRNKSNAYQITTNGIGPITKHQNPEQNTGNNVPPLEDVNPEQRDINPEQRDPKPGTRVPPNRKEPSKEPSLRLLCVENENSVSSQLSPIEHPPPQDEITEAFDVFSEMAKRAGLPVPVRLSEQRAIHLRRRLAEAGGIEGWRIACQKVERSAFCTGQNRTGWKADLDFMLQKTKFTKIMEGSYDHRPDQNQSIQNRSDPHFEQMAGFARLAAKGPSRS